MLGVRISALALAVLSVPAASLAQDHAAESWEAGDWAAATAIWTDRAMDGDLDAQYNLAQAYRMGKGVPQSLERAVEYYRSAAMSGHKDAAEQLGLIYYDEPKTRPAAVEVLRALASEGRPRAAYIVGLEHMSGEILQKDLEAARYFLKIAADGGVPMAIAAMGKLPDASMRSPKSTHVLATNSSFGSQTVEEPALVAEAAATTSESTKASSGVVAVSSESSEKFNEAFAQTNPVEIKQAALAAERAMPPPPPKYSAISFVGEGHSIWFGPFRNNTAAGIKFARIAARAGLDGPARFVPTEDGIRVEYGLFEETGAADYCDRLNLRRYQCRGVVAAQSAGGAVAPSGVE